jgi:DNA-binding transcriptional regulator YdaS (Cro superfamily)
MTNEQQSVLRALVAELGGPSQLAAALSVQPSAVTNWLRRGIVPPEQCVEIELLTNGRIKREQLRPDIFSSLRKLREQRAEDCSQ